MAGVASASATACGNGKPILKWTGLSQLALHRHYAQNPPIGYQSVSDTWSLASPVRKVEFKLIQAMRLRRLNGLLQTHVGRSQLLKGAANEDQSRHRQSGALTQTMPLSANY
jgi:hypothetical protein